MYEILKTDSFSRWLDHLPDVTARARILVRIERLAQGNQGDTSFVGGGVSEMKIDHGPGYRVYYMIIQQRIVILLAGGDKRTQKRDINQAIRLAKQIKD